MTKVLGTKLSTLWTRINTVLVPRQATVTTTGSYHIVTLQNAVTPTPDALVSFSIPASSGDSGDSNQNAFSNVKVGSSTISATSITDTLSVTAGNNISLSVNSKTLTISATDTTYTAATVAPLAVSSSSVTGTSTNYARQDHTHSIAVTTGDSNGQVKVAGINATVKGLGSAAYTASTAYLPSNITIPTAISQLNNDAGYLTSADIPEGASAYSGTISTVTSGTSTAGTNNGFARGDHVHNITTATITNVLGYTPYSAANPNGYTSNTGTVTGVKINNSTKAPSSGIVDIGTVLTTYTYTLPTASTTTLGGIKIGSGLNIGTTGVVSANVQSVNTKTGAVTLTAADVGALSSSTVVPTQTSQLQNNSGFLTSAVTSLNSKTGTVTITAGNNVTVSSSSNTITISATDTKDTAGATATSSKIYLIGATATTTNPQTYSNSNLYYDNGLYSYAAGVPGDTSIYQAFSNITLTVTDEASQGTTRLNIQGNGIYINGDNPKITGLATPTTNTDAVNKEYVDNKYSVFTGATTWTPGTTGLVPSPPVDGQQYLLYGDGAFHGTWIGGWNDISGNKYTGYLAYSPDGTTTVYMGQFDIPHASTTTPGLMSATDKAKLDNYDVSMTVTGNHTEILGHLRLYRPIDTSGHVTLETANNSSGAFHITLYDTNDVPSYKYYFSEYGNIARQEWDGSAWGDADYYIPRSQLAARFSVQTTNISPGSVAANSTKFASASIAKSGYTPIGVSGYYLNGAASLTVYCMRLDGTSVQYGLRNPGSSASSSTATLAVQVIYAANS